MLLLFWCQHCVFDCRKLFDVVSCSCCCFFNNVSVDCIYSLFVICKFFILFLLLLLLVSSMFVLLLLSLLLLFSDVVAVFVFVDVVVNISGSTWYVDTGTWYWLTDLGLKIQKIWGDCFWHLLMGVTLRVTEEDFVIFLGRPKKIGHLLGGPQEDVPSS